MTPRAIVPTPAAQFAKLRGRRVVVGVPGLGWRADLRADDAVVHGSRTFVPVLTEHDYYRAETEQIEIFAPLVPIDRVWVEHLPDGPDDPRLPQVSTLDAPPRRQPVPAGLAEALTGRRVVQAVPDGHVRELRAVTEVYRNALGVACARICGEPEWYRWAISGTTPSIVEVSAELLWIE